MRKGPYEAYLLNDEEYEIIARALDRLEESGEILHIVKEYDVLERLSRRFPPRRSFQ